MLKMYLPMVTVNMMLAMISRMTDAELDQTLARLEQPRTVQERLDILRAVTEYWHGPIAQKDGIPSAELSEALPLPLQWWYGFAGRRDEILSFQNVFAKPKRSRDGHIAFYQENQGGYFWSTLPQAEDPPVYGRQEPDLPWTPEGMTLSEFLIQVCLFEGIVQSPQFNIVGQASATDVSSIIAPLHRLQVAAWRWPGYPAEFYYGDGAFVFVSPFKAAGEGVFSVFVGGKSP